MVFVTSIIVFVLLHRFVRQTGRHARINVPHLLAARGPAPLAPGSLGCHLDQYQLS